MASHATLGLRSKTGRRITAKVQTISFEETVRPFRSMLRETPGPIRFVVTGLLMARFVTRHCDQNVVARVTLPDNGAIPASIFDFPGQIVSVLTTPNQQRTTVDIQPLGVPIGC